MSDSGTLPRRVATFDFDGSTGRCSGITFSGSNATTTTYYDNPDLVYDKRTFNYLTGSSVSSSLNQSCSATTSGANPRLICNGGNTNYAICYDKNSSSHVFWYQDANQVLEINTHPIGGVTDYSRSVMHHIMYMNNAFYAFYERFGSGDPFGIAKWSGTGEVPANSVLASYQLGTTASISGSTMGIGVDPTNSRIYVGSSAGSGATDNVLWEFDDNLTLLDVWQRQDLPTVMQTTLNGRALGRYNNYMWFKGDALGSRKLYAFTYAKPFSNTEVGYTTLASSTTIEVENGAYVVGEDGSKILTPVSQTGTFSGTDSGGISTVTGVGSTGGSIVGNSSGTTGGSMLSATSRFSSSGSGSGSGTGTSEPYGIATGTSEVLAIGSGTTNPYAYTAYSHLAPLCDVCGFRYPSELMRRRWDGLWVCPSDWEQRHIADFIRVKPEQHKSKPWIRPEFSYPDAPSIIRRVTLNTTAMLKTTNPADFSVTLEDFMLPLIRYVKIYINDTEVASTSWPMSTSTTVSSTSSLQTQGFTGGIYTAYAELTLSNGVVLTSADVDFTILPIVA